MKNKFKIAGIILFVLLLLIVGIYFYLTDFRQTGILYTGPRKPKLEIPVTYNIGWWSDQKALQVNRLKVDVVESRLSLFNSKSLVSYHVMGQLAFKGHWQPRIEEVHISERINRDTLLHCDRIIEITPVIQTQENKKVNGGIEKFEFKNEHTIASNHWGINRIKFICGQQEQTIELHQVK